MNLKKAAFLTGINRANLYTFKMLENIGSNSEHGLKERLLDAVKKEVKQLIEESVTKKYIHCESVIITNLCAAIEACLSDGLKRRTLGLFKTSSTTALLHKIGKYCPDAEYISKLVQEIELNDPTKKFSWSSESFSRPLRLTNSAGSIISSSTSLSSNISFTSRKYLWIRLALYEKRLIMIINYLVQNAVNYYEKDSLLADRDYAHTLNSLLAGLNALEFTKSKSLESYSNEPHADELVQRYRLRAIRRSSTASARPPLINFKRNLNTTPSTTEEGKSPSFKSLANYNTSKHYVESLQQNVRSTLLYGKNNVQVLPKNCKEPLLGYLSLHQQPQSLIIKWAPNQLIDDQISLLNSDTYWEYALNINVNDIVYVHCHRNRNRNASDRSEDDDHHHQSDIDCDNGGTIVLVSHDGIQWPPIIFPEGDHMQQFLSCLETGLLPHGQLDPPLWSQSSFDKIFSWPKSVRKRILSSVQESFENTTTDYVFRIVSKSKHEEFAAAHSIFDFVRSTPKRAQLSSCSTTGSSDCSSKSLSIDHYSVETPATLQLQQNASIEMVCSTMRLQIISRAFYGWLAYCKHLSTVRTHLSELVHKRITPEMKSDKEGLTLENWHKLTTAEGIVTNAEEVYRLVYYGGIVPELRKQVWPYLLGHYQFGSTQQERSNQDEQCRQYYETTMSEWLAVEAIVQQKDKEKTACAIAKLSSESTSGQDKTVKAEDIQPTDLDNEVFEDMSDATEAFDLQRDSICKENYLTVQPLTRVLKTSTDSGHVDDIIEEFHQDIEPDKEQQGRFSSYKEEMNQSSASTSSYDTPDNNYELLQNTAVQHLLLSHSTNLNKSNDLTLISPEYLSADDTPYDKEFPNDIRKVDNQFSYNDEVILKNSCIQRTLLNPKPSVDVTRLEQTSQRKDVEFKELKSLCPSPISSNGGVYSNELLENFGLNLHRIEKDVQRCDRNFWYFANFDNLDKLRNVITTYVWENLSVGYMQGMCDLVAPLLVILDDESLTYSCFCKFMKRMIDNFPNGNAMDLHFVNIKFLVQILDPEMYDLLNVNGDQTHLYFCYRWFLLDFKRELLYDDIFATWEVIWAAKYIASTQFVLFFALALLETYRDVILANSMDFTDVIKFFNEMAEHHNAGEILQLARNLVLQLQIIIENK